MGDGHVDIVGHRRQGIKKRAVGPHQHRIGHGGGVDLDRPAHQVGPPDFGLCKPEAPMRRAAFGFPLLLVGGLQAGPVVDGRQLARRQQRTLAVELGFGLVTGIDAARRLQLIEGGAVFGKAIGLAIGFVPGQAQPFQVAIDRVFEFFGRARRIGVVDPQQELAAFLFCEQPVQQRGTGIAGMKKAGR